ncbi:MAG: molybdopterin-dependent oxidoreductase [Trebonia sp.]
MTRRRSRSPARRGGCPATGSQSSTRERRNAGLHRPQAGRPQAASRSDITTDIHCVTQWSKLGTHWRGVSLDVLLDGIETNAAYVMARSYGGYTTNLPLPDLRDGKAWIAYSYEGKPLVPEHGRLFDAARLLDRQRAGNRRC